MKKTLAVILAVGMVFALSACGSPAAAPQEATTAPTATVAPADPTAAPQEAPVPPEPVDDSWDKIQAKGSFILGLDDSFPPMGFRDENNEIVGFDIDMARAVAEYLGVEVELKPVVWDTVIMSLTSGDIDCIWNGMSVTPARLEQIAVSKAYVNSDQIIVTLADSAINTKADLAGKIVGTQMGSSTINALDTDPATRDSFGELKEYATFTEAVRDLENKRLDAIVIDGIAFFGDFNVKSPGTYKVLAENFDTEEMAIGLRKEDVAWKDKLNEAFAALRENGKAAEISKKWFGEDILII